MVQHKQAFTLIELLVVVLIIGILAAVAVPQYRRSVLKAEVASVLAVGRAVRDAENIYYLANGTYTTSMDELDVEVDCPKGWECYFIGSSAYNIRNPEDTFGIDFTYRTYWLPNKIYCWANRKDNDIYLSLCKSYGPDMISNSERYTAEIRQ